MEFSKMRVIPCNAFGAQWNMAADEYLLTQSKIPVLRFYQWSCPTLSFGRSNADFSGLDFTNISYLGIQGVIRQTGGKTVLHHKELTYSFVAQNITIGVLEFYKNISMVFQKAFHHFGVKTQMKKKKIPSNSLICFQEISSYEIEVFGRKLVGSAQKRKKDRVLQHGSILLDIDFVLWSSLWKISTTSLKKRIISLHELIGKVSLSSLVNSITCEFQKQFQTKVLLEDFNELEKKTITAMSTSYFWKSFESQKMKNNERKK